MNKVLLNPEAGNLPQWSEQEAERLSKLRTFQPNGWTPVGSARAYKGINNQLRALGITGSFRETVARDICDLARLKAVAK